jgi:hypothetical protein
LFIIPTLIHHQTADVAANLLHLQALLGLLLKYGAAVVVALEHVAVCKDTQEVPVLIQ